MAKINLNELKDRKRAEGLIEIETDAGIFTIDPPELWADSMVEIANSGDNLALSKALLGGEEQYQRFVDAGGSQALVGVIIAEATGVEVGKSSASSRSSKSTARR